MFQLYFGRNDMTIICRFWTETSYYGPSIISVPVAECSSILAGAILKIPTIILIPWQPVDQFDLTESKTRWQNDYFWPFWTKNPIS